MDFSRMTAAVPVISLSLPTDRFAQDFGASFERFGFAMIADHGIDPALIDDAWAKARQFFALPEAAKRAYRIPGGGGARGYTPFGTEIATGATEVDLKAFWHVGRALPAGPSLPAQQPHTYWQDDVGPEERYGGQERVR